MEAKPSMKLPPGVVPNATYVERTPRLPPIHVPWTMQGDWDASTKRPGSLLPTTRNALPDTPMEDASKSVRLSMMRNRCPVGIFPSPANAALCGITPDQLFCITGLREQCRKPDQLDWVYEMRRQVQAVLDFISLGPSSAARNKFYLQEAGITLLLAVRDTRIAKAQLLNAHRLVTELGIEARSIDVTDAQSFIRMLPQAVRIINEHMLQHTKHRPDGSSAGRVLIFCETGNTRAPVVVLAYVMSMFGLGLVEAVQFVSSRRFCMDIDKDHMHMLLSYSELLRAQCDIAAQHPSPNAATYASRAAPLVSGSNPQLSPPDESSRNFSQRRSKRHIEDTMEVDDDRIEYSNNTSLAQSHLDIARYQDRRHFTPFVDTDTT